MNKLIIILSSLILGTVLFNACDNAQVDPPLVDCSTLENIYTGDVSSILENSCQTCHTAGSAAAPFPLDTYSEYTIYLENGLFESEVLDPGGRMAVWGNMSEEQIETIRCWFDAGYPEN
jgi:mono/diheme cytochrome c family protein